MLRIIKDGILPTGRSATIMVAASNATANEIAQADYVCDGTADDVQIQAAITALAALGGTVRLTAGLFTTSATIFVNNDVVLTGAGVPVWGGTDLTTITTVINDGSPIIQLSQTGGHNESPTVSDLKISGIGTEGQGIYAYQTSETQITNVVVTGVGGAGIDLNSVRTANIYKVHSVGNTGANVRVRLICTNVHIDKGHFGGSANGAVASIYASDSSGVWVTQSYFEQYSDKDPSYIYSDGAGEDIWIDNNYFGGIVHASHQIVINSGDAIITNNVFQPQVDSATACAIYTGSSAVTVQISNNAFKLLGGFAVYVINAATRATITGNTVILNKTTYADARAFSVVGNYAVVANNIIESTGTGTAKSAIAMFGDYVTVSGNTINGMYGVGIEMTNTDFSIVVGNVIENIGGTGTWAGKGIWLNVATYTEVIGNVTKGCGTYGIETRSNTSHTTIARNTSLNNGTGSLLDAGTGTVYYTAHSDIFMDVLAVTATHVRSNEDLSAGVPITFTLDAQPDVPRTLSGHFDTHAQITAYTIAIVGVNAKGVTVTETFTEAASPWDFETSNAFSTVTSITMSARTGTGAGDTMDIGITDVLGLSDKIYATSDVYKIKKNAANATVAVAQVNATYDTYDMSVITLAATDDFTIWYKSNLNIVS